MSEERDEPSPTARTSKRPRAAARRHGARHAGAAAGECVHHIVLGAVQHAPRRWALHAAVLAAVLHVGGVALAITLGSPPLHDDASHRSQPLVVFEHVVDLTPPAPKVEEPPPPAPPPPVELPRAPRVKAKAAPAPEPVIAPSTPPPAAPPEAPPPAQPPSEPPPAAQTGQVVAAAATAEAAPSFAIATGSGQQYAGGTSASNGTGAQANHTGQVGVGNGNGLGRARPAQLQTRNPPCGWPPEAEDSDLEEAFVTVRAAIGVDGRATAVEVLSDPGSGFGKRMQWCIRTRMRFTPALDAEGRPVAGSTQPFRVRFVREE